MPGRSTSDPEKNCKLFVGGLSFSTTEDELREFYEQFGTLVDVVVMKERGGKSRGFGFVTYKDPDMLDEAQANRPHVIHGRTVEPKRAMPREDSNSHEAHLTVNRLFVVGLKPEIKDEDLKEYFSKFGNIVEAEVKKSRETGESRGFGFITFDDYDAVDKAVLTSPHLICKCSVDAKKAFQKESGGSGGGSRQPRTANRFDSRPSGFGDRSRDLSTRGRDGFSNGFSRRGFDQSFDSNRFRDSYAEERPRFAREPIVPRRDSFPTSGFRHDRYEEHFRQDYMPETRERDFYKSPPNSAYNSYESHDRYAPVGGPIKSSYHERVGFERSDRSTPYGGRPFQRR